MQRIQSGNPFSASLDLLLRQISFGENICAPSKDGDQPAEMFNALKKDNPAARCMQKDEGGNTRYWKAFPYIHHGFPW